MIERTLGSIAQAPGRRKVYTGWWWRAARRPGRGGRRARRAGMLIGPRSIPGVPWTFSIEQPTLALAVKSGNFGAPDFFSKRSGSNHSACQD